MQKILFVSSNEASIAKHHSCISHLKDYGYNPDFVYIPGLEEIHLEEVRGDYSLIFTDHDLSELPKDLKFRILTNMSIEDVISEINVFLN